MARTFDLGEIWNATLATCRRDLALYVTVAAPFTLLPQLAADLFGPPLPDAARDLNGTHLVVHLLLPAIVGGVAQLAIARMAARGDTAGAALRIAAAMLPGLVVALVLGAAVIGFGLLALVVPGLYLWARLALAPPLIAIERLGPLEALRRSFALSADAAWTILGFLVALFGVALLAAALIGAIAAGVNALASASLGVAVGGVAGSLVAAIAATLLAVLNAIAGVELYRRLH